MSVRDAMADLPKPATTEPSRTWGSVAKEIGSYNNSDLWLEWLKLRPLQCHYSVLWLLMGTLYIKSYFSVKEAEEAALKIAKDTGVHTVIITGGQEVWPSGTMFPFKRD